MSQSKLEARLIEPALCHTFPGRPTCLAHDIKNEHIAVGFHNGKVSVLYKNRQVKVLSHDDYCEPVQQNNINPVKREQEKRNSREQKKCDGSEQEEHDGDKHEEHDGDKHKERDGDKHEERDGSKQEEHDGSKQEIHDLRQPVKLMSFCYEEMTNKTFLVTKLKGISKVFLWSFTEQSKCVSKFVGGRATVLTWSPSSSILYVGTSGGDVIKLKVSDSPTLALEEDTESFVSSRIYGEVVAVTESPLKDLVLVVFSSGVCMMKNKASKELTSPVHNTKMEPVAAWWKRSRDKYWFEVIDKNGTYATIEYKSKHKFVELERRKENGGAAITKAQCVFLPDKRSLIALIAYTGDSPVLLEGIDKSHVITMVHDSGNVNIYPLTRFDDRVVDFVFYEKFNKNLLIVLTEADILLLTTTKVDKIADGVMVGRYDRYDQLNAGYPYITPPVTCLHHCGECSKKCLSSLEEQSRESPELVVTGHNDGSVRLWLCSYKDGSLSFDLLKRAVDTESYFEDNEEQQKKSPAVSSVKIIDSQYLLVIKESGRVLLFSLWKISDMKSQSQEIILMEKQDGPSISLKTPPPHFCPRQQLKHVQLLQHFSCFYQTDGQADDKQLLEAVTVTCADYNEQMGMLAVGTVKCLVVIDTKENMLVQVIGSENKLLKLCLDLDKHKQNCSVKDCDVVCLETAMISWKEEEAAQHTLWVGTRGGSLGAFKLVRDLENAEQVLQLKATGLGTHFKESIKGFHFDQNMKQEEKDVAETEFTKEMIHLYTTNLVVTTKKYFQIFRIPGPKEKIKDLGHGSMMWSGLIQCQDNPVIVYVTKDGRKLASYNLTDYNYIGSEILPADCHPVEQDLFSSNGKHAIMKCSDRFYYIMDSACEAFL